MDKAMPASTKLDNVLLLLSSHLRVLVRVYSAVFTDCDVALLWRALLPAPGPYVSSVRKKSPLSYFYLPGKCAIQRCTGEDSFGTIGAVSPPLSNKHGLPMRDLKEWPGGSCDSVAHFTISHADPSLSGRPCNGAELAPAGAGPPPDDCVAA